jgi:GNAT superfamily N-acetyltransferase
MTMEIKIREAIPADLPLLLNLYAHIALGTDKELGIEQAQELFDRIGLQKNHYLYIATIEGSVVGSFALLIMANLAHQGAASGVVEDVVVHPDWQGRGIGKQMMKFALARCKEAGCYKMTLSSNLKREVAHKFYESLGFEKHGYSFRVK